MKRRTFCKSAVAAGIAATLPACGGSTNDSASIDAISTAGAEISLDAIPCRGQCFAGKRDAVCSHVSDVAGLVQPLSHLHRLAGGHVQLAVGLLLQRGRGERRAE